MAENSEPNTPTDEGYDGDISEKPLSPTKSEQGKSVRRFSYISNRMPACRFSKSLQNVQIRDDQINYEIRRVIKEYRESREERQRIMARHLGWLHSQRYRKEEVVYLPVDPRKEDSEGITPFDRMETENVMWHDSTSQHISEMPYSHRVAQDEDGYQAFLHAIDRKQEREYEILGSHYLGDLSSEEQTHSHLEVDAEGVDAVRQRIRVQRLITVRLKTDIVRWGDGEAEQTTLQLKRKIIVKKPYLSSFVPQSDSSESSSQMQLEQLAQHELDMSIDERNCRLREVFKKPVDNFRRVHERYGPHKWICRAPVIQVGGSDGVFLRLVEEMSDTETVEGDVSQVQTTILSQLSPNGRYHLFDLPFEGTEFERRIRKARWDISSAIDKCCSSGSGGKFVMDKWVQGSRSNVVR